MSKGFSIKCSVCGAIDSIVSIEVATHRYSVRAGAVGESGRPSIDFDGSSGEIIYSEVDHLECCECGEWHSEDDLYGMMVGFEEPKEVVADE